MENQVNLINNDDWDDYYDWDYFNENEFESYHPIVDANNLYNGFIRSRKGSHWKPQVQRFRWNLLAEIRKLQVELNNTEKDRDCKDGYKLSPYSKFVVHDRGKLRAITALHIRDRIVKHVLNDLYLIPHIRPHLIYDNGASLTGKGISFSRNRLKAHLEQYYKENNGSADGYIMTMDFSGYYDNINHEIALSIISKYERDEFARYLVWQAFDSYKVDVSFLSNEEYEAIKSKKFSTIEYRRYLASHPDLELSGQKFLYKSISVGDHTSQTTGIVFPTIIDNLVKVVNGVRFYGRYMDDLYIISNNVNDLLNLKSQIENAAKKLKLFINPKKTLIRKISKTFTFLQFKYYLRQNNGHVVIRINPKTVTAMRRKLKKLCGLIKIGKTKPEKAPELLRSWIMSYSLHLSKQQRKNIISLYQKLYGGGLDEWLIMKKQLAC